MSSQSLLLLDPMKSCSENVPGVFRKSSGEEYFVPKLETRRAVIVNRGLWRSSPGFSIQMNTGTENKKLYLFFFQ